MFQKELLTFKEDRNSNLVLSEGTPIGKILQFLVFTVIIIVLYFSTVIIMGFEYVNKSNDMLFALSNGIDFLFNSIIYGFIMILILGILLTILDLLIRKKVIITYSEVIMIYCIFKIPLYKKNIRKYDIMVYAGTEDEGHKISPIIRPRDQMFFKHGSSKIHIRNFMEQQQYLKISDVNLLIKHGIQYDENLSNLIINDNQEDLSLDPSLL